MINQSKSFFYVHFDIFLVLTVRLVVVCRRRVSLRSWLKLLSSLLISLQSPHDPFDNGVSQLVGRRLIYCPGLSDAAPRHLIGS